VPLLRDRAAGDASARVAGRIRLHVVGSRVNHDGRPAVREQGVRPGAEVHVLVRDRRLQGAVRSDRDVHHVAGVRPVWVLEAVLLDLRIEVSAGGREAGRLAFGHLMDVDRVLSGRQVLQVEGDADSGLRRRDLGGPDRCAAGVLEFYLDGLCAATYRAVGIPITPANITATNIRVFMSCLHQESRKRMSTSAVAGRHQS